MKISERRLLSGILCCVTLLSGCTTSEKTLASNPSSVGNVALCRSYIKTGSVQFHQAIETELYKRSIAPTQCKGLVDQQNKSIALGIAAVAIGAAAIAVCSKNDCGGGGRYYSASDWDAFYNQHGQIVWACRDIASGQFTYDSNCSGKAQTDLRWPGLYA
jgi:outer membrane protein assembly factor BamE (lipoprotein component of BamABCDE complex)